MTHQKPTLTNLRTGPRPVLRPLSTPKPKPLGWGWSLALMTMPVGTLASMAYYYINHPHPAMAWFAIGFILYGITWCWMKVWS